MPLNLKFKRQDTADAAKTTTTMPTSSSPGWTGHSSLPAESNTIPVHTRELRTRAEMPTAPPIATLFSRESSPPQQTLAVWDPGEQWPGFSLYQLALVSHGRISEITLVQDQADSTPVARLRSTVLSTPSGQPLGVLSIEAPFHDPRAMSVAMTLLEQVDRPVILAGSASDKDLIRRIGETVRAEAWRGASLLLVSPADKPSRADRLRRANWPRGMRMHVLELFATQDAGWSQQLISLVSGYASPEPTVPLATPIEEQQAPNTTPGNGPLPVSTLATSTSTAVSTASATGIGTALASVAAAASPAPASRGALQAPTNTNLTAAPVQPLAHTAATASPAAASTPSNPVPPLWPGLSQALAQQVLQQALLGPGVTAAAWLTVEDGKALSTQLRSTEHHTPLQQAARTGAALWRAHRQIGSGQPLQELQWTVSGSHVLVLPLARFPELLLLVCVDREFGDLPAARWQLAVARQQVQMPLSPSLPPMPR